MEKLNLKLVKPADSSPPSSPPSSCEYGTCDGDGYIHFEKDGYDTARACQCLRDKTKIKCLGERFYRVKLDTLIPKNPKQERLKNYIAAHPTNGVFLFGKGGAGKTHFLAAAFNYWDDQRKRIKYLEDATLKDELRNAELNNDYGFVFDLIHDYDAIFIDDVGKQAMTPFFQGGLYRLFNEAYKNNKYIFITANDSLATLGGDEYWGSHVARRVEDICEVVEF